MPLLLAVAADTQNRLILGDWLRSTCIMKFEPKVFSVNGWSQKVTLDDGKQVVAGLRQGKRVRRIGHGWVPSWVGFVKTPTGRRIWTGRVPKDFGVKALLEQAWLYMPKNVELIAATP